MPADPFEAVALHRWALIAEACNPRLSPAERGRLVRALAARAHPLPDGGERTYARSTLDRWIRAWRARGLEGLRPQRRSDAGAVRRHPELLAEAAALRAEAPARSAAHIADILLARHGVRVSERTVRAHLAARGLSRAALCAQPGVTGRYEATRANERWIGDVLVGPFVPHPRVAGSRRVKLFVLVDDYSRLLVHGWWTHEENTRAGQHALRQAIVRRGAPEQLYVDNGSPFRNAALARTCAVLGIHLVHSRPYRPQGRGKQERLNRVIRERFLVEACQVGIPDLAWLNDRFTAWVAQMLNTRVHSETGQTPLARFVADGAPAIPDAALLADAFRWSVMRVVTRTATVALAGNRYSVDPALTGRRVELRYDPEDLSLLHVHFDGRYAGTAEPLLIGRHSHPRAPQAARPIPPPTGIDYLGLVQAAHDDATGEGLGLAYRDVPLFDPDHPDSDDDGDGDDGAAGVPAVTP